MKSLLKNLLWLLALVASGLSPMLSAAAHVRFARPAPQVTLCSPHLQIESVTYLGRSNGKDNVQVIFNGLPATISSGFNNSATAPCSTYGVPVVNTPSQFGGGFQGNFSNNTSFQGGAIATSQGFGYEIKVTITRRLGHQDTGTTKSSNIFSGQLTTVVQIPRGVTETDPVKYDVTINTTFGGVARRTLTAQGNGAPVLASATQTFANSSLVPLPDNCFPSVSITGLTFTAGSGATPDAVTIDWTANHPPSDCFLGPKIFISVEVKRPDNSTGRASTQANATSMTLNLSGAAAAPVSFTVRVSAETGLGQQFQVNKKGEF